MMTGTKIIAVTINKGGAGKTMISRSLATAAAYAGLAVLILDMDTQQNSTNWRRRRPEEDQLPLVQFTTENDLEETLKRAQLAECDLVIIDTPPGRSTEAPAVAHAEIRRREPGELILDDPHIAALGVEPDAL